MIRPSGIIAAMSTPFFEDETLNEEELRHQVDRLIGAGVHGIFALGTNGENYAMDFAEKVRVMEIVIDQAKHRVPVYVGNGRSDQESCGIKSRLRVGRVSLVCGEHTGWPVPAL